MIASDSRGLRSIAFASIAIVFASFISIAGGCNSYKGTTLAAVPDSFVVSFETSRGRADVMVRKSWSPLGAGRFYDLLNEKHFDGARFFRVLPHYIAQFGLSGDPTVDKTWLRRTIDDEPMTHANAHGTLTFARGGAASRSSQLFFNLKDNLGLDSLGGFGPIGEVTAGLSAIDSLYSGYGDATPRSGSQLGKEGPVQDSILVGGNAYLERGWPKLDFIKTARIVQRWPAEAKAP
jgi:peptidyl-prolyl cis-trans isomerase A (cyclophilin A)